MQPEVNTRRPLFEVAFTFTLIVLILWTPRPEQGWLSLIALAWILGSTFLVSENRQAVELGIGNLGHSLWVIATAVLLATLEIFLAHHEQTLHLPFANGVVHARIWGYVIWSFLQQFILQNYFLVRMLRICRKPWMAVAITGGLFAFAHVPNPVLTVATLVWGVAACALFLRYRDLYSLGVAHAVFGLTIAICVPAAIHHNMRVGIGYLHYRSQGHPIHRSQIDHKVSTDAWVMTDAATLRSARQARP